jgi:beta-1,4-N-acetylglucosaminyltransferase
MRCFVTVGTTRFDGLIDSVLNDIVLSLFHRLGFREISIQAGSYDVQPLLSTLNNVTDITNKNDNLCARAQGINVS